MEGMNEYEVFYDGRSRIVHADTSEDALMEYAKKFHVPDERRYLISVWLISKSGGRDPSEP